MQWKKKLAKIKATARFRAAYLTISLASKFNLPEKEEAAAVASGEGAAGEAAAGESSVEPVEETVEAQPGEEEEEEEE